MSGHYDKALETRTNTSGINRAAERRPVRSKQATAGETQGVSTTLKDFTKAELVTVCTTLGLNCSESAKELSERIFKNLLDLASLKNNFTEQLTDDEDGDSVPFSLESTNDANRQPFTPPIYQSPSSQVFAPLLQTQRNQSQRGNEENAFLLKDLFTTMSSFTGNDNYSVKAFFRDVEENFIFIPHI
ncbi:hypothetical protein TNCV_2614441 [Trichonephila clavipes]|nr:hypothetical protein TNCV_2614441 [Trichonephila clavipes]